MQKCKNQLLLLREKKSRDLNHVKCIKSNNQNVLMKDNNIKERWKEYFKKLLNEDYIRDTRTKEHTSLAEHTFFSQNQGGGSEESIETNEDRKGYGPYDIPIEA